MGEIYNYQCKCGYETELSIGGGINSINRAMTEQLFPNETAALKREFQSDTLPGYSTQETLSVCDNCKELVAVATLCPPKLIGTKALILKPCPKCGSTVRPLSDTGAPPCPKCGKKMSREMIGLWD